MTTLETTSFAPEDLSALIADIYDTTFDLASWPRVLEKICAFIPGCGSNLFSQDAIYGLAQLHYSWGDDPDYVRLYLEKYADMNPLFPAIAFGEVGRVGVQSDIISYDEFHETRFYREWVKPQGYVDVLYCLLEKSETGCAMITVRRSEKNGLADDEACRRMDLITPHVRRAILISRALEHNQVAAATLTDILDTMSTAVFLLGSESRLIYANRNAEALLAKSGLLSHEKGRISALSNASHKSLTAALTDAARGNANSFPLPTTMDARYIAHVLPLSSGLRQKMGQIHEAVAAIFIREATVDWASPAELVAKAYKLTPSEIRVLLAIAEHSGTQQAAASLGLSEETVKSHLKHIFQKTEKGSQAELVKLLAAYANPQP